MRVRDAMDVEKARGDERACAGAGRGRTFAEQINVQPALLARLAQCGLFRVFVQFNVATKRQPFVQLAMVNEQHLAAMNDKDGDGEINLFVNVSHDRSVSKARLCRNRRVLSPQRLVWPQGIGDNQRMSSVANVLIHSSQFPDNVRRDLLVSLRTRQVNHKFHYDSVKQTQKWLALHQAHSPSRNDADCAATYDAAFAGTSERIKARSVHVLGLGCGGGQKDTRLLKLLHSRGAQVSYTPCDVSTAMVLMARETALSVVREAACLPVVCDLATAGDLSEIFKTHGPPNAARLITFFGMIPNFEPDEILPKLASLVRNDDWLLFSANLAPGADYAAGVQRVLPQYDNLLTRDWLLTFLLYLGVERDDGEIRFCAEEKGKLKRIVAHFHFARPRQVEIENETFEFRAHDTIQLFFSYRYTPALVHDFLKRFGLEVFDAWVTRSEEEGAFLVRRSR